ncbi:hypothetical protein C2G38_2145342 [Gigaspora rosea]|uniref:Uncharacterized protein n=1 Tax=Gigaspora rosea TaxID=44941 RepID=A0A397UP23_9GLOM|nr:hypothetical protein C2G38_2145342 [Gigaspora rosea]
MENDRVRDCHLDGESFLGSGQVATVMWQHAESIMHEEVKIYFYLAYHYQKQGFMSLLEGVAFGGYCFWRMLLLEGVAFGWRCFWRAYVAFGGFMSLLEGL